MNLRMSRFHVIASVHAEPKPVSAVYECTQSSFFQALEHLRLAGNGPSGANSCIACMEMSRLGPMVHDKLQRDNLLLVLPESTKATQITSEAPSDVDS